MRRKVLWIVCGVMFAWGFAGAVELSATGEQPAAAEPPSEPGEDPKPSESFDARDLERRLAARGMAIGAPIMIRIFKSESLLELWMAAGTRFEPFAAYRICNWSGELGPKLAEGDKQSPEGLYSIGRRQLRRTGRWPRSLDIGFPNTFDRAHGRTGSLILVHGGCTSTGCYAMTDPAMEEIFRLSEAALARGQKRIQVHVFPFRMTPENLAAHAGSEWAGFWSNLKEAYDLFERTRVPPPVAVCDDRYAVGEDAAGDDDCVANVSTGPVATTRWRSIRRLGKARSARRRAGRNVRKAYAARAARRAARQRHAETRHRTHR